MSIRYFNGKCLVEGQEKDQISDEYILENPPICEEFTGRNGENVRMIYSPYNHARPWIIFVSFNNYQSIDQYNIREEYGPTVFGFIRTCINDHMTQLQIYKAIQDLRNYYP